MVSRVVCLSSMIGTTHAKPKFWLQQYITYSNIGIQIMHMSMHWNDLDNGNKVYQNKSMLIMKIT